MRESDSTLMICDVCGEPKEREFELLGKRRRVRVMCKCRAEEYEREKQRRENLEKQRKLERLKAHSLMDRKFEDSTFDNWKVDKLNAKWKRFGERYCENFGEMKSKGIGFLMWGPPGTGKTFLTSCIANRLLSDMVPVISISSIGLLNRIKETYGRYGQEGEVEIINSLRNASLLILDDLGSEGNKEWATTMLYQIIDSRYRDGKPMLVSTNLTNDQLREKLTERTYDRLIEMCTPIEIGGPSKRAMYGREKTKILRDLMR